LLVYLLLSILFLLWPFDFALLQKRNNVRWLGTVNGIEFPQEGQVLSASSTEGLCGRFLSGKGFALEIWAATDNLNQTGPARIVSYSLNPAERNFTLGQSKKKLIMRLRTTETDLNGVKPHVEVDNVFSFAEPQHIVVAYDFSEQKIFVNGEMRLRQRVPAGRFTNWDPSYYLVLGNEATGDRPWIGKIFYLGIYNRALSKQEIRKSYLAGRTRERLLSKETSPVADGLVIQYQFEERKGNKILSDNNTNAIPDLYIPKKIRIRENAYLSLEFGKPLKLSSSLGDVALNILVFVLLGLLFHAELRSRYGSSLKTFAFVLIVGTLFTFGIESLQHLSVTRHSSFIDMLNNILGITVGICADRFYEVYLNRQIKLKS
jgi:VanZ family protein